MRTLVRLTHVESARLAATIESTKTYGSQQGAALMKRTTKYVAFDVHQATTVASVREEGCSVRFASGGRGLSFAPDASNPAVPTH